MMKMLLTVEFPREPFNMLVRDEKVGEIIGRVLENLIPETVYFTEQNSMRAAFC